MKSELDIQTEVIEALKWEPSVGAAPIGISVPRGIVILTGQVQR